MSGINNRAHETLAWSRPTQYFVSIVLFIAGIALLVFAWELVATLIIAALITFLLNPLMRVLEMRLRLRRSLAATTTYIVFLVLMGGLLAGSTPLLLDQATTFSAEYQRLLTDLEAGVQDAPAIFGIQLPLTEWITNIEGNTVAWFVPQNVVSLITNLSQNLLWVVVTLISVFYLLHDWQRLRDWAIRQAPPFRRDEFIHLYVEVKNVWQAYLRGQLVLSLIVGADKRHRCRSTRSRGSVVHWGACRRIGFDTFRRATVCNGCCRICCPPHRIVMGTTEQRMDCL